jgi:hypothetical protein
MNTLHTFAVVSAFVAITTFASWARGAPAPDVQKQEPTAGSSEEVSGTVAEIDHSTGALALASRGGTLKLHFPPSSISEIKQGDTITAWLAIEKAAAPAGSTRAYDAPIGSGQHRMTGVVGQIRPARGWVSVKSGDTELDLRFTPEALKDLNPGDSVVVDLAFTKAR